MPQLVRWEGKHTAQRAHCAMLDAKSCVLVTSHLLSVCTMSQIVSSCEIGENMVTHCLQKGRYFKVFGILGPYWVLIYISGSLFSLFWFHSRKECQFSLHVYEKLNKSYEAHHL